MGAGKSTKSKQIAQDKHAVLLSEDEWLSSLYPNQIESFEDYLKFSATSAVGTRLPAVPAQLQAKSNHSKPSTVASTKCFTSLEELTSVLT